MKFKVNRLEKSLIKDLDLLTSKQISARFGLRNPRDAIMKLRRRGYVIVLDSITNSKNKVKRKYFYSTATEDTRGLIALGYLAKSAGYAV